MKRPDKFMREGVKSEEREVFGRGQENVPPLGDWEHPYNCKPADSRVGRKAEKNAGKVV